MLATKAAMAKRSQLIAPKPNIISVAAAMTWFTEYLGHFQWLTLLDYLLMDEGSYNISIIA